MVNKLMSESKLIIIQEESCCYIRI